MSTYTFHLNPVPASRPRVSKYGTYYLPTYRNFRDEIKALIKKGADSYTKESGPLRVTVDCFVTRPKTTERDWPRGDVDNYAKAVLDSLNGVVWDDDDQIIHLTVIKRFEVKSPRIVVGVYPVGRTNGCKRRTRRR